MDVLISVDLNYLDKAQTMLFSLGRAVTEQIHVYLLNHSLNDKDITLFNDYLSRKCNAQLHVIDMTNTPLDSLTLGNQYWSSEMYYRLIAQFFLPKSLNRILWLDADIVVLKDISEFYYQSFDNKYYVVCRDRLCNTEYGEGLCQRIGLPDCSGYFNSGVMLMNLGKLREETALDSIVRNCMMLENKVVCPDQDMLNVIYLGKVKYADSMKYNYQADWKTRFPEGERDKICILHYTTQKKPWNYWCIEEISKDYWKMRYMQGDRWPTIKAYLFKIRDLKARKEKVPMELVRSLWEIVCGK